MIESGIRQRIRLAATDLAEAASAGDLDAAASLAGQACRDIQADAADTGCSPRQLIQATARQLHTLEKRRRQNLGRTGNPSTCHPGPGRNVVAHTGARPGSGAMSAHASGPSPRSARGRGTRLHFVHKFLRGTRLHRPGLRRSLIPATSSDEVT